MLSLFFWEDWLSQALSSTTLYEWDADIVQLVLGTHFCSGFSLVVFVCSVFEKA